MLPAFVCVVAPCVLEKLYLRTRKALSTGVISFKHRVQSALLIPGLYPGTGRAVSYRNGVSEENFAFLVWLSRGIRAASLFSSTA